MTAIIASLLLLALSHQPKLPGSHELQLRQNQEINEQLLPRVQDDNQLHQLIKSGELVRIPEDESLKIVSNLLEDRRYCRPWIRNFVVDMASAFYRDFGQSLVIDSVVRTAEQQVRLRRHNRAAAPAYGDTSSSHLAGTTVDIAKRRYNRYQRKWITDYLTDLKDKGLIIPIEERNCYHVFVSWRYAVDSDTSPFRIAVP